MIDREQVRKVAHLARLELSTAEEKMFTTQLNGILDYFGQLNELDVANIEPTFRAIDASNITRQDVLEPHSDREAILENAPDRAGEFFKVPKIIATD